MARRRLLVASWGTSCEDRLGHGVTDRRSWMLHAKQRIVPARECSPTLTLSFEGDRCLSGTAGQALLRQEGFAPSSSLLPKAWEVLRRKTRRGRPQLNPRRDPQH